MERVSMALTTDARPLDSIDNTGRFQRDRQLLITLIIGNPGVFEGEWWRGLVCGDAMSHKHSIIEQCVAHMLELTLAE